MEACGFSRRITVVLSSRFPQELQYALGTAVCTFLLSEEEMMEELRESWWVEGTAGIKAWRRGQVKSAKGTCWL